MSEGEGYQKILNMYPITLLSSYTIEHLVLIFGVVYPIVVQYVGQVLNE